MIECKLSRKDKTCTKQICCRECKDVNTCICPCWNEYDECGNASGDYDRRNKSKINKLIICSIASLLLIKFLFQRKKTV